MNILMGYNFFADSNALDPFVASVGEINNVTIENAIYEHLNVVTDVTSPYSSTIPTTWTINTIMDCDFANNINAGSINNITAGVTEVRIKRRKVGEYDWTTIKVIPISSSEDFNFAFPDYLTLNSTDYEYAFVPVMSGVEGDYNVSEVYSYFNGVFICDEATSFKLLSGVNYGTNTRIQKIGTFEPLGRKYPAFIANAVTDYETGGFATDVIPVNYMESKYLDREAIVKEQKLFRDFLVNKKPKILKDINGNAWLCLITGSPNVTYNANYGMGFIKVNSTWTQIGEADNREDLYNAGLIPLEI